MFTRENRRFLTVLGSAAMFVAVSSTTILGGDEPGRLGRLFRGASPKAANSPVVGKTATRSPYDPMTSKSAGSPNLPLPSVNPAASPYGGLSGPSPTSRIVPQPRATQGVTESDPMITRISIGRADDGKQFCMFVQVFADGTVLDSEGIHKVGADSLRPIAQVIETGDLARLKGHCGGPSSDFIEQVHMVAYDRYLGRLRAHSFSYSGNPQGCDESVQQLNSAIDALQAKLAGPPTVLPPSTPIPTNARPIGLTPRS